MGGGLDDFLMGLKHQGMFCENQRGKGSVSYCYMLTFINPKYWLCGLDDADGDNNKNGKNFASSISLLNILRRYCFNASHVTQTTWMIVCQLVVVFSNHVFTMAVHYRTRIFNQRKLLKNTNPVHRSIPRQKSSVT